MYKILNTKIYFSLLELIFVITSFVLIISSPAFAVANAQNTYTYVNMPAGNLTNISEDLTINSVASLGTAPYFWSHQFGFSGSGVPSAGGAYIGLQGINRAVFSVFDYPSTESSSDCVVSQNGFDGYTGESGTSCILSYTVTQGHTYRLQVTNEGQDAQGINWLGQVTDLTTGQTTTIATINIAANWGNLSASSSVWTEWFGASPSSCSALPYDNITFSNFTANNGQYASPSSTSDILQTGTGCSGYSQIVDNSYNSFTQIMGIDPPITNIIVPYNPPSVPVTAPVKKTPTPTPTPTPTSTTSVVTPAVTTPTTTTSSTKQTKTVKPIATTFSLKTSNKAKPISLGLAAAYTAGIGIPIILIILGIVFFERFLPRHKKGINLPADYGLRPLPEGFVSSPQQAPIPISIPQVPTPEQTPPQTTTTPVDTPPITPFQQVTPTVISPTIPQSELPKE